MSRLARLCIPYLPLALALAWLVWLRWIYWPANMSPDSLEQYGQARLGIYTDHHPPIMAISLRLLFHMGLGIGTMISLQCIAGFVGLLLLIHTEVRLLIAGLAPATRAFIANLMVLAIVSPITPFYFYLLVFWKDSWLLIGLLWASLSLLWLIALPGGDRRRWLALGMLLVSSTLSVLSRHNALLLLPLFALILGLAYLPVSRKRAIALALLPIITFVAAEQAMHASFDIRQRHIFNVTMAHDALALCVYRVENCAEVPYTTRRYGGGNLEEHFVYGDVMVMLVGPLKSKMGFPKRKIDARLREEWLGAITRHPIDYLTIKLISMGPVLNLRDGPHKYFKHDVSRRRFVTPRSLGIEHDPALQSQRDAAAELTMRIAKHPLLNPLLGSHAPWLAVALIGSIVSCFRSWRRGAVSAGIVLFGIPLVYYLSYLPPAATSDWRYMFPATFLAQCALLSVIVAAAARRIKGSRLSGDAAASSESIP